MQFENRKLRHEFKYYLNLQDYLSVSGKVASFLEMDKHSLGREGYGIRSLYFDGMHNHSLYDKNEGYFAREKYRIRIYNGTKEVISLERKSKFGDYVCKESARLSYAEYESILHGDASLLAEREEPLIKDFYRALIHRSFRPAVIVDYVREAYVYELGNVRITFDKMLSAGINTVDLFDPGLVLEETISGARTIMEVKYDAYLPEHIRKLAGSERHNRSSISKYVICREARYRHFKE